MILVDRSHQLAVAALRIVVGIIFLWAGLEKVIGAGSDGFSSAGFLQFGTGGTLGWPFVSGEVAEGIIDILVPWGQIGIGLSLTLGLFTRFGAAMGTLMMLFFFFAAWEFEHGIVNSHLTYAVVTAFIGYIGAGNHVGLDRGIPQRVSPAARRWLLSGDPNVATDPIRSAAAT